MYMYNLTDQQKALARWLVQKNREGKLNEDFNIFWFNDPTGPMEPQAGFTDFQGADEELSEINITQGALDALASDELIRCNINYKVTTSGQREIDRRCTLTAKAYDAVDTDFSAPDTSFLTHLTPLADVSGFDAQLKQRCLPILGAGSADPTMWDSAARTAGVILEERLREVGSISDPSSIGTALVNKVFAETGTLAPKFAIASERQGYRDLYAGVVGVFRNPSAHRLIDPTPQEGGAFIVLVNLLLSKLEALR